MFNGCLKTEWVNEILNRKKSKHGAKEATPSLRSKGRQERDNVPLPKRFRDDKDHESNGASQQTQRTTGQKAAVKRPGRTRKGES